MADNPFTSQPVHTTASNSERHENALLFYPTGQYVEKNGRPVFNVEKGNPSIPKDVLDKFFDRNAMETNWTTLAQRNTSFGGTDTFNGQFAPLTLTEAEWRKALFMPLIGAAFLIGIYGFAFKKKLDFFD